MMNALKRNIIKILFAFSVSFVALLSQPHADLVNFEMAEQAAKSFLNYRLFGGIRKSAVQTTISEIEPLINNENRMLAYIVELKPDGFIILSGDTNIEPVIGYSLTGEFPYKESPDNVLLHLVTWDMDARFKSLILPDSKLQNNLQINNEVWRQYISDDQALKIAYSESNVLGPWITTNWHQRSPYNDFCPLDPSTGERCLAGCTNTATAQIFNYWKYPESIHLGDEDSYVSEGYNGNINIPEDNNQYDFPTFNEINNALNTIQYNGNETEAAYICFALGIKLTTDYSSDASSAGIGSYGFKTFGYTVAKWGDWPEEKENIINNMKNAWPVNMSIDGDRGGHAVIVDGYDSALDFYHINFGWSTSYNTWYSMPNIGTDDNYNVISGFAYNIVPVSKYATIKGTIKDLSTSLPISSAVVTIIPGEYCTITDNNGEYSIDIPGGQEYSLKAQKVKFNSDFKYGIFIEAEELKEINFSLGTSDSPTVAYYHFEGDGLDYSGNDFNLQFNPEDVTWTEGKFGKAVRGSVQAPGYGIYYPGDGDWTVEAWVKTSDFDSNWFLAGNSYKLVLWNSNDSNVASFDIRQDNDNWDQIGTYLYNNQTEDEWLHIAGVYNYKENMKIYINGQLEYEKNTSIVPYTDIYQNLRIGNNGTEIDELRITAAALEPSEFIGFSDVVGIVTNNSSKIIGNSPNPFNTQTTIEISLGSECLKRIVQLHIYNLNGQKIKTLLEKPMNPGFHKIIWDGIDYSGNQVSSGIYLYELNVGSTIDTGKMLLIK